MALAKLQNLLLSVILEGRFFLWLRCASPDYETTSNRFAKATLSFADNETTSQQDNEWDFASPDYETTSQQDYKWDFASQTSDKSHETKGRLRLASQTTRLLVNKTTSGAR